MQAWGGLSVLIAAAIFTGYTFLTTYYTITGSVLQVRSGFLINRSIDIATVKTIIHTHSMLSAPALSMDRLEVTYNTYDSIVISPKDKESFIAALKAVNNAIEVKLGN